MRIVGKVSVKSALYDNDPNYYKYDLARQICDKIVVGGGFCEVEPKENEGKTELTTLLHVLTFENLQELEKLGEKYPELKEIIKNIVL